MCSVCVQFAISQTTVATTALAAVAAGELTRPKAEEETQLIVFVWSLCRLTLLLREAEHTVLAKLMNINVCFYDTTFARITEPVLGMLFLTFHASQGQNFA